MGDAQKMPRQGHQDYTDSYAYQHALDNARWYAKMMQDSIRANIRRAANKLAARRYYKRATQRF